MYKCILCICASARYYKNKIIWQIRVYIYYNINKVKNDVQISN